MHKRFCFIHVQGRVIHLRSLLAFISTDIMIMKEVCCHMLHGQILICILGPWTCINSKLDVSYATGWALTHVQGRMVHMRFFLPVQWLTRNVSNHKWQSIETILNIKGRYVAPLVNYFSFLRFANVTRSSEMSRSSKISISIFLHHCLTVWKCFILMQTPLQLDVWLQSYEEFVNAKNIIKQRNLNTVFAHI